MRQWIRSHLTYANVMVTILVFIVLGSMSYAATGGNLILGKPNTASSTSSLSAPVNGKALNLTNTSTGAGATALGLNVASGHAPFTINSGTKVKSLNADTLDGKDSTAFVSASNLRQVGAITVTPPDGGNANPTILSVGHFTFLAVCRRNDPGFGDEVGIVLSADVAHSAYAVSQAPSGGGFVADMAALDNYGLIDSGPTFTTGNPMFFTGTGTAIDSAGQQVQFDLYAGMNARNQPGECVFGGTFAVKQLLEQLQEQALEAAGLREWRDTAQAMSQVNVEIFRRAFEAYERGDLDAAVADMAPDCEYLAAGTVPGRIGTYRGSEG